jgi:serine/threonine protein kinase
VGPTWEAGALVHCLRSKAQPQARDERPFARLVTDVQTEGHEVSFLGTEGYIAPEGPGAKVSDIYSLGRLIYMAAMGRDQRQFPDLPTALVQGADPVPVLRLNKIILTACHVNPSARYQSAEELRGALKELLHDLEGGGGRREGSSM